jgi:hypothetical protein
MRFRCLLAVGLGLCAAERAEAQLARVERRGPLEVAGTPGEAVTIPFRVTSLSAGTVTLPGEAALPAGWRATGGTAHPLAPGENELRLLGVRVPAGAAAGRHLVRYAAGGSADSAVVVVAERREIAVEPAGTGVMVMAGEAYEVRFRVANRGNVAERLALRAEGDQGIAPRADTASLLLPPASERVVAVRAATDRRGTASLRHQVTLHATSSMESTAGRTLVTVVPRGGGRAQRRRLPAELRVRAADSLAGAGFAFTARGALDRAGRVRLDVEARTADPAGTPYARQDEYRLRLESPGLSLRLGDGVYALSRLTEPGRYGFGAGATVHRGVLSAGGVLARDRRGDGRGGVAGGFARVGGPRARLGANLLLPDSAAPRWTLQATAAPFRLLSIEAEAAPAGEARQPPRSLRVSGHGRRLSYEALHLRGAPTYGGTGSADQDFASLALRPFGELSLSASVRRGGNFRLLGDTVATFSTARRAAAGWGSRFTLEYQETGGDTVGRGDLRSLRARAGIPLFGRVWLHPGFEAGRVVPRAGAAPAPFRVVSLQSTVSARGGASLWAYAQLREGASVSPGGAREWSGALSAHLPVLRGTWVRVSGQARRAEGAPLEALLDLSLERSLGGGHRIAARGLASAQAAGGWRPRGYLEYALPVAVPIPGADGQRVTAHVVDRETGKGIPHVLVRMGDRVAFTDRRGVAGFGGLAAGAYTLRVEPGAGPERVADRDLPVPVTVGAGAQRVEIGLERAGRVTGTVRRVPAGASADSAAAPMAGVEVELAGPGPVRRVTTDAEGRFDASGLRPGWYRVRMAAASLPRHHELREEQMILVPAGGAARAILHVVERERPVQMIQGGELTLP